MHQEVKISRDLCFSTTTSILLQGGKKFRLFIFWQHRHIPPFQSTKMREGSSKMFKRILPLIFSISTVPRSLKKLNQLYGFYSIAIFILLIAFLIKMIFSKMNKSITTVIFGYEIWGVVGQKASGVKNYQEYKKSQKDHLFIFWQHRHIYPTHSLKNRECFENMSQRIPPLIFTISTLLILR